MVSPWTEEERVAALATFKKIAENNRAWLAARSAGETPLAYPMPHDIYEAHRLTMKSISSEVGIFDEQGRIFLTKRPSADENPAEPYPGQWHIPGTRHIARETNDEALQRLIDDEIGAPIEARLTDHKEYPVNEHNKLSLLSLLYVAHVTSGTVDADENRQWFNVRDLPNPILEEHREIVSQLASRLGS